LRIQILIACYFLIETTELLSEAMEDSDEEEDAKPTNGIRDQKGKTKKLDKKKVKDKNNKVKKEK
jgi:hypothetical protein